MATSLTSLNAKQGDIDIVSGSANLGFGGAGQNLALIYQPFGIPYILADGANVKADATGKVSLGSSGGTIKINNVGGTFTFTEIGSTGGGATEVPAGSMIFAVAPTGSQVLLYVPPPPIAPGDAPEADQILSYFEWTLPTVIPVGGFNLYFDLSLKTMTSLDEGVTAGVVISVLAYNPAQSAYVNINLGNFAFQKAPNIDAQADNVMFNNISGVVLLTEAQLTAMGALGATTLTIALLGAMSCYTDNNATQPTYPVSLDLIHGQMYPVA